MVWLIKIVIDLAGSIAAIFLAPIVCAFARYGSLPKPFRWMETPDNPLPGDLREPLVRKVYERFGFYLCSVYWLGWRNRAYGLSMRLAFRPTKYMRMRYWGNRDVSDDSAQRGWAFFRIGRAWEFYAVVGKTFGLRVRVGYKLQPFFQTDDWSNPLWGMPVLHLSVRRMG